MTALELGLLESATSPQRAADFDRYARRQGADVCPYLEDAGCSVYAVRPFSCRTFGHHLIDGTTLPDGCVFDGHARRVAVGDYFRQVPGAERLRDLSRDFQMLHAPAGPGAITEDASGDAASWGERDGWDEALRCIAAADLEGAARALPGPAIGVFSSYVRGLLLSELGLHEQALESFNAVLLECPQRPDLRALCGFHRFQLGDSAGAEADWLEAVRQDPERPLPWSFLGYLALGRQEWQWAVTCFGAAERLEPEQPLHGQRRRQAQAQLAG